jgi:phosphoglycerol transferase MdoB-like AlkP superfamily enzyme
MTKTLIHKLKKYGFIRTYLIFQILTRFTLSVQALISKQISLLHLPAIFTLGLINDFVTSFYFIPIVQLLSGLIWLIIRKPSFRYYLSTFFNSIYIFILLFIAVAEVLFWDEYGTKFNFIAVDYLIYTQEIIGTLKDSLPITPMIVSMVFISIIITYIIRKTLRVQNAKFSKTFFAACSLFAILATQFYNSNYAFFSNNRYANELTLNGPYEFIKAFINNSLDYNIFYTTLPSKKAIEIARNEVLQNNQSFIDGETIHRKNISSSYEKRYNIVLLSVESLSAEFINYYGSQQNITPNIDKLVEESLVFNNIYAVGTRTVRGLEALTLSVPPTPGSSIIRRPHNDNLFNIGTIFKNKGYDVKFIFGGYSYFDNLNNFFSNNNFQIVDRSDLRIEEIFYSNIWGVADENILTKALEAADNSYEAKKPFFQLIMTTSNHRPYTFPDGRIDLPSGGGRAAAVKYTDYAIGKFIEQAKSKKWFKDTIFIITADHCASSAGKTALPINKYHIPLLIYAPSIIKPAAVDTLASQIDIPPTILGLLNFNYNSKFFGKDILKSPPNRALISTYQLLGYLKDSYLVILTPNKEPEQYKVEGKKLIRVQSEQKYINAAISYYQSAYELYTRGALKENN